MTRPRSPSGGTAVVSSAHLAAGALPALSEVEFSLHLATTAFHRWIMRCMAAAGMPQLSAFEILVLHSVRHRDRKKRQADIALVLDIEEMHVLAYALRKLEKLRLIVTERAGKEKLVAISEEGLALCERYAEIREALLVQAVAESGPDAAFMSEAARMLRALSGAYNQAARSAATL